MIKSITVGLFLFLISFSAYCCSCDVQSFEDAVLYADEIFTGRIIELKEIEKSYNEGEAYTEIWSALFEVEKKWKGSKDKYIIIYQNNTSCDFNFKFPGNSYLVYARQGNLTPEDSTETFSGLTTWLCSRTAGAEVYNGWIDDSWGDDRPLLDKRFPNSIELRSSSINLIIYIIGGLATVLIFGWVLKRKYTPKQNAIAGRVV